MHEWLLWVAGACVVLAVMAGSVGGVLQSRGPATSEVPVAGFILRVVALVLVIAAVGFAGAWLIVR